MTAAGVLISSENKGTNWKECVHQCNRNNKCASVFIDPNGSCSYYNKAFGSANGPTRTWDDKKPGTAGITLNKGNGLKENCPAAIGGFFGASFASVSDTSAQVKQVNFATNKQECFHECNRQNCAALHMNPDGTCTLFNKKFGEAGGPIRSFVDHPATGWTTNRNIVSPPPPPPKKPASEKCNGGVGGFSDVEIGNVVSVPNGVLIRSEDQGNNWKECLHQCNRNPECESLFIRANGNCSYYRKEFGATDGPQRRWEDAADKVGITMNKGDGNRENCPAGVGGFSGAKFASVPDTRVSWITESMLPDNKQQCLHECNRNNCAAMYMRPNGACILFRKRFGEPGGPEREFKDYWDSGWTVNRG